MSIEVELATFGFRKALQPSYALAALSELVYGWFTEGFDTLDLKQAKALLGGLCACQRVSKRPLIRQRSPTC